ncbi:MAG TPA: VOC family protein [Nitrososphaerales archaeon]|nr:VOC family protein [Nitrososphaerales archaeon]
MVTKTVVHFEIPANDLAKLSKFYSDVFGWKFEKAQMQDMDYWTISTGPRGKSVGGGMYKRTDATDVPRNYIGVDKIDKHIEVFKKAGGREVMGKAEVPRMGWSFIGADPEGNLIALFETVAAPRRRSTKRKK